MLKLSAKPRRQNAKDPAGKRCAPFLKWLRGRECILVNTGECWGKVRACHWDQAGDKGVGTKVSDKHSLPMCDGHHAEQGEILGWPKFQLKYAFRAADATAFFWNEWLFNTPMGKAWRDRTDG